MNKRTTIIVLVISVLMLIGLGVSLFLVNNQNQSPPSAANPSPADEHFHEAVSEEARAAKEAEQTNNPILKALPYDNSYWSLEFGGQENGKYIIIARVLVGSTATAETVIAQQRPFVEQFLAATGQPSDSYSVRYAPEKLDD